jgi:hypothetical protein
MKKPILRFCCVILLVLCGCGKDPNQPDLVPMSGKVLLDDQPLAGADITFIPVGGTKGSGSTGRTDAEGVYKLTAIRGGSGAVPGEYRVVISKRVMSDGSDFPANSKLPPIESPAKETLSPEYSDRQQSKLTATVPAQGETKDFQLKASKKPR